MCWSRWLLGLGLVLGEAAVLLARPPVVRKVPAPATATRYQVPYRLTDTLHLVVRVKINGQGPFHFVVDTGAPTVYVLKEVGQKLGLKPDAKGWATLPRLEVEGGVVQTQVKARIESPFQLVGLNALGLAGMELHGILGYSFLAHYRLQIDLTQDQLLWTPLAYQPPAPQPLLKKKGEEPPDLEVLGPLMKLLSWLVGRLPEPQYWPRGYVGLELAEREGSVVITRVVPGSPAASAGLRAGDQILQAQGKAIHKLDDLQRQLASLRAGQEVRLHLRRGTQALDVRLTAGEGL